MTAQDCLEELRRIRDAAFATVDETGAPQVRIIDVMLARAGALLPARGADTLRIATKPMTGQQRRTCSLPDDRLGDCAYSGAACPRA